jgi:DNA-binding beta-propeller fold protein YncE
MPHRTSSPMPLIRALSQRLSLLLVPLAVATALSGCEPDEDPPDQPADAAPRADAAPAADATPGADAAPGADASPADAGASDAGPPVCVPDGEVPPGTVVTTCEAPSGGYIYPSLFLAAEWDNPNGGEWDAGSAICQVTGSVFEPLRTIIELDCHTHLAGTPMLPPIAFDVNNSQVFRVPEALAIGTTVRLSVIEFMPDGDSFDYQVWKTLRSEPSGELLMLWNHSEFSLHPPQDQLDRLSMTLEEWYAPLTVSLVTGMCPTSPECGGTEERAGIDFTLPGTGTARLLDRTTGYIGHSFQAQLGEVNYYSDEDGCRDSYPDYDFLVVALNECDLGPRVEVLFPPPRSNTDQQTLTVRGVAADNTGITAIRINGVEATTTNAFASWQATVPLQPGANTLFVETEDPRGNVDRRAATLEVTRSLPEAGPAGLLGALSRLPAGILATGQHSALSVGEGAALGRPDAVVLTKGGARALVLDGEGGAVIAIDLWDPASSGQRSVLSGPDAGSGPLFDAPMQLAYDPYRDRVFVTNQGNLHAVFSVDPTTGARTLVSGDTVGTGTEMLFPQGVASSYWILMVAAENGLFSVDVATGDRQLLSGASRGSGPPLDAPGGGMTNDEGFEALVINDERVILSVETFDGDRAIVSGGTVGTGPQFGDLRALVLDQKRNLILATQEQGDGDYAVWSVNPFTGARTLRASKTTGTGPHPGDPRGIALDERRNVAVVTDVAPAGVFLIDLATGERVIIAR